MVLAYDYEPAYTGPKMVKLPFIIHRVLFIKLSADLYEHRQSTFFNQHDFKTTNKYLEIITAFL